MENKMRHLRAALAAVLLCVPTLACAQSVRLPRVLNPGGATVPALGAVLLDGSGFEKATNANPVVIVGKQESFQLVASNTPSAAVSVAGGDYILTQTCSGYGTVTFLVLGPNAADWLPLGSYTSSDAGSGHGFALGSYAKVRVTVSGTTGCSALLARVPA